MTPHPEQTTALRLSPVARLMASPWAILPERLNELAAIADAHFRGTSIDLAAVEAKLGRQLANEQPKAVITADGVATLHVSGVMAPKANLMTQISGGVSTQMLAAEMAALRADPGVRAVLVEWDSPGGQVQGIPAAAAALQALALEKPTVSIVTGAMASAAYWVGSAANAVYLEGPTDVVGSIGVYQRVSWRAQDPNTVELVRGEYKRPTVNGQGPSAKFMEQASAQLSYVYTVLVDAVAAHRGTTSDLVLQHMADGRIFTGELAIRAGLADGMATADQLRHQLATDPAQFAKRRRAVFGPRGNPSATLASASRATRPPPAGGRPAQATVTRAPITGRQGYAAERTVFMKRAGLQAAQIVAVQAEHAARGAPINVTQAAHLIRRAARPIA